MKKQRFIYPVLFAALLSGCSLIPNYDRPGTDTPAGWTEGDASSPTIIAKDWWKNFGSEELNTLMDQALANNNDLNASLARVEQARANAKIAGSSLLPNVDASGSAGYDHVDPGKGKNTSDWGGSAGLSVGYELDIFGQNRANAQSADYSLLSSGFASDATALIVMGDVAKGYFNVLNLEERLQIADQNLDSAKELLRIVQARFDAGATTALDVSQQKAELSTTEATRASVEQQLKIAHSTLAILLGKAPESLQVTATNLRNLPVPQIAPGQPSNLLERRPDIRSSESDLLAANANIGAARAAFFPNVTLGLDLGVAASPFGDPATKSLSLASGVLAPIFEGGLLEGNLEFSKARKTELVENYRKTVLTSFKDVEDALVSVKASQSRETSLETALTESRKAYDLSKQQYDVGSIDFQTLLDTRRTMLAAEDSYVQTKNDRLAAAVDLYKALGGGWAQDEKVSAQQPAEPPATGTIVTPATETTNGTPATDAPATTVPESPKAVDNAPTEMFPATPPAATEQKSTTPATPLTPTPSQTQL